MFEVTKWLIYLVRPAGFEPATYGFEVIYSFCNPMPARVSGSQFIRTVNFYLVFKQFDELQIDQSGPGRAAVSEPEGRRREE